MRQLVINADDFGANPDRDRGILECLTKGIVTSISVLQASDGLSRVPSGVGIGLHLNLTEGSPITRGRTLGDAGGRFWPKEEARRRAKSGHFDPREIEAETTAQIERLRKHVKDVTHLDGHQHLHVYPDLAEPVARAAKKAGLKWIRAPGEERCLEGLSLDRQAQLEEYRALSQRAREVFEAYGLQSAAFHGAGLTAHFSSQAFEATIRAMGDCVNELMVHPGFGFGKGFDSEDRDAERRLLTSDETRALLAREEINLTHFGKL